jgi:hypothetical protein
MDIYQFWIFLYEHESLYFDFENFSFKFSIVIWFEPKISILNYYFRFSKLVLLVWKLLSEFKNQHFNFEYCYLNLKIDISILEIFI